MTKGETVRTNREISARPASVTGTDLLSGVLSFVLSLVLIVILYVIQR